jgi:transcriptional regulator with XRE-family HTH domain
MAKKSKFEIFVIDKVRKMRLERDLTQDDIADFIDATRGFVGQVESPKSNSRYSLHHLNSIAIGMKCSPRDFFPEKPLRNS